MGRDHRFPPSGTLGAAALSLCGVLAQDLRAWRTTIVFSIALHAGKACSLLLCWDLWDSLSSSHPRTAVSFFCIILLKVTGTKAQEGAFHVLAECIPTHCQHELTLVHINTLPA